MSVVATALKELMALGVTGDALVTAIERIEAAAYEESRRTLSEAVAIATARADDAIVSPGALRQRRYRARNIASPSVTKRHQASLSDGSDAETLPEEKVSPTPPSKTQTLTPSEPKGSSGITTHAREAADFERFWEIYPRKTAKGAARKAYLKAAAKIGGPDPPAVMIAALERAIWPEAKFIPHPATWLNDERWTDEPPNERDCGIPPKPAAPNDRRANTDTRRNAWTDVVAERDGQSPRRHGDRFGDGGTDRGGARIALLAAPGHRR